MITASGIFRIYLAGPSVFREDSIKHGEYLKSCCALHGAVGHYPLDNVIKASSSARETALLIRKANEDMMRQSDAAIADMTPFRGPGMDGGTAYEIGYMAALGKPVVAYSDDTGFYSSRIDHVSRNGILFDRTGLIVEDFGLNDNLMMSTYVSEVTETAETAIATVVKLLHLRRSPAA